LIGADGGIGCGSRAYARRSGNAWPCACRTSWTT